MNMMNTLIILLFILAFVLMKLGSFPVISKLSRWALIIVFTVNWGVGGYVQYPILANVAGLTILIFWITTFFYFSWKLLKSIGFKKSNEIA